MQSGMSLDMRLAFLPLSSAIGNPGVNNVSAQPAAVLSLLGQGQHPENGMKGRGQYISRGSFWVDVAVLYIILCFSLISQFLIISRCYFCNNKK